MAKPRLKITQVRSSIGRQADQRKTLIGLGLNKTFLGKDPFTNEQIYSAPFEPKISFTHNFQKGGENDKNNPNGAVKNIAGIFNEKKNVLGMMPHPERMIDKYLSGEDGSLFFENLLGNLN